MKNLQIILTAVVVLLVGCEGPEGPTGARGKDGNANVASSTLTILASDWDLSNNEYTVEVDYPAITQDIVDDGAVLVYLYANNTWENFPVILPENGFTSQYYSRYYFETVVLHKFSSGGVPNAPATREYKIVVIASFGKYSNDVNWNNYNEVKQKFNLAD